MEWHQWRTDGTGGDNAPAITQYGYDDLDDAPQAHWWRAYWSEPGISLRAYPIIRKTPTGVWIAHHAWREKHRDGSYSWTEIQPIRWMSVKSAASWAKPTRELAVHSLAVRLTRWTTRVKYEFDRAERCCDILSVVRPDLSEFAKVAIKNLHEERQSVYL